MKRLFLISASMLLTLAAIAQVAVTDNALFQFRNGETPTDVARLGTAPEFPFLRYKTSANQVYTTIKRHSGDNNETMNNLNGLLMQVGYANGAKDLTADDVTEVRLEWGAIGNMGSRGHVYGLYRLQVSGDQLTAWKIAANSGSANGPLYILAACGNSFYPKTGTPTACVKVPVSIKPDLDYITLPASGSKVTTDNKTYVYYTRKRHKKDDKEYPVVGLNEKYPSDPLPIVATKETYIRPEIYTVSLGDKRKDVSACENQTLALTANVNVEKTSTYTGNYPQNDNATYQKVTKRHYKMIARKMHNAERKANKVAKKTGQPLEVKRV